MQRFLLMLACTMVPFTSANATTEYYDTFRKSIIITAVNLKTIAALPLPNDHVAVVYQIPFNTFLDSQCNEEACVGLTIYDANGTVLSNRIKTGNLHSVTAAAVDHVGRIVVIGATYPDIDFGVLRFLPDGEDDTDFNYNGSTRIPFDLGGTNNDIPQAVAIDHNDNIVVAGSVEVGINNTDFGVIRLLEINGNLDANFGIGGKTRISFDLRGNANDQATAVAISNDDKIILGGVAYDSAFNKNRPVMAQLISGGRTDSSFCPSASSCTTGQLGFDSIYGGRLVYYFGSLANANEHSDSISSIDVADDGKIVIAGTTYNIYSQFSDPEAALALLGAGGALSETLWSREWISPPSLTYSFRSVRFASAQGTRIIAAGDITSSVGSSTFLLQAFDQNLSPIANYGTCPNYSQLVSDGLLCFFSKYGPNTAASLNFDDRGRTLFAGTYFDTSGPNHGRVQVQRFITDIVFQSGFEGN